MNESYCVLEKARILIMGSNPISAYASPNTEARIYADSLFEEASRTGFITLKLGFGCRLTCDRRHMHVQIS